MPSGSPTSVAAAKEPSDSRTCRLASRQNVCGTRRVLAHYREIVPGCRMRAATAIATAVTPGRRPWHPARAADARARRSRAAPAPASGARTRRRATRARTARPRGSARWRLTDGERQRDQAQDAGGKPQRPVARDRSATAPTATSRSTGRHPSTGGSALSRRCGSPAAMRLALNTRSGARSTASRTDGAGERAKPVDPARGAVRRRRLPATAPALAIGLS